MRGPSVGQVFRSKGPPQETRTVLSRTLGGHVIYRSGRIRGDQWATFPMWAVWAKGAKRVR
jgi:hypothetical protein